MRDLFFFFHYMILGIVGILFFFIGYALIFACYPIYWAVVKLKNLINYNSNNTKYPDNYFIW